MSSHHNTIIWVALNSLDDDIRRVYRVYHRINEGDRVYNVARLQLLNHRFSFFAGQTECRNVVWGRRAKRSAQSSSFGVIDNRCDSASSSCKL
ncbi:hypothetical protein RRF57_010482 [Xylaria bambusicola]|uniref:Uncharacterized protein n=1 Tax=Xylaria bambusicola TaxID=326684 RepID=A0AAN7V1H5_9PEZI